MNEFLNNCFADDSSIGWWVIGSAVAIAAFLLLRSFGRAHMGKGD